MEIVESLEKSEIVNNPLKTLFQYCECSTKVCNCENDVNLTKGVVDYVLNYYNITNFAEELEHGLRGNVLHVYGVDDLSTKDILGLWPEFKYEVEWIDDCSCNLVVDSIVACFELLDTMTEECIVKKELNDENKDQPLKMEIWRKVIKKINDANELLIRFAKITDVKPRGAEKRSRYYVEHGNPNYGNVKGLFSKSYRKRLKRKIVPEKVDDATNLVSYDDLPSMNDDDDEHTTNVVISSEGESDSEVPIKTTKLSVKMKLYSDDIVAKSKARHSNNVGRKSVYSRLG